MSKNGSFHEQETAQCAGSIRVPANSKCAVPQELRGCRATAYSESVCLNRLVISSLLNRTSKLLPTFSAKSAHVSGNASRRACNELEAVVPLTILPP